MRWCETHVADLECEIITAREACNDHGEWTSFCGDGCICDSGWGGDDCSVQQN